VVRDRATSEVTATTTTSQIAGIESAPVELGQIPPPHPGPPQTIYRAPGATNRIALTIDDGYCAPCASAYVDFAQATGLPITFSPNGVYASIWNPLASPLRDLIAQGQVQIGNHTFSHHNLLDLSDSAISDELERNDEWIQTSFGVTSRPWFRPPYGYHDARVDDVAANLGFTYVLMWSGTFGDSTPIAPRQLLQLASSYLRPGVVMLGHANHPTIIPLLDEIYAMISDRGLEPVTLDALFGTSRSSG
jgi:peptidoglycan-N-acetylglucosamine deacetylase